MALEGSLRDFDLFSLFNMIKIQGKNGSLLLTQGQDCVKVFFENGEIVGCDSNRVRMEDRLGTMLVRLGRLTGEELLDMIQIQRQTLKRMGTLLLEDGKVTPSDIQDALFSQATAILYRSFRWVEGNYRFDSMLPPDLDRDHFVPIPVDTVLMEAARIQDEWPDVQRRLPGLDTQLAKSAKAEALRLDIDHDVSSFLDGKGQMQQGSSGLTHEQEMVLSYFDHPQSINDIIQVSRYEELDSCKAIADLIEAGLLEPIAGSAPKVQRPWVPAPIVRVVPKPPAEPSGLLWPLVVVGFILPLALYVPHSRGSMNMGLASLQPADVRVVPEGPTRLREAWALRMAAPKDGGALLAKALGRPLKGKNPVSDLTLLPDPLIQPATAPSGPATRRKR